MESIVNKAKELATEIKAQQAAIMQQAQKDIASCAELTSTQKADMMQALKQAQQGTLNIQEFKKKWALK